MNCQDRHSKQRKEPEMEKPQSLFTWVDHNRSTTAGVFVALIICGMLGACQFKADSIMTPGKRVTRAELKVEVIEAQKQFELEVAEAQAKFEVRTEKATLGLESINKKDAILRNGIETAGSLAKLSIKGALDPSVGIAAVLSLAGVGGLAGLAKDNRKKNKIIADAKNKTDSA